MLIALRMAPDVEHAHVRPVANWHLGAARDSDAVAGLELRHGQRVRFAAGNAEPRDLSPLDVNLLRLAGELIAFGLGAGAGA